MTDNHSAALEAQIAELEQQIQTAKARLEANRAKTSQQNEATSSSGAYLNGSFANPHLKTTTALPLSRSFHPLLLLSDSALPLGSFAYSSGLESFLAHHKPLPPNQTVLSLFHRFLTLSIQTVAYTNVPYVLASFNDPSRLADLDNDLDASTPCTVARRASVAQGRALLGVWEKAFVGLVGGGGMANGNGSGSEDVIGTSHELASMAIRAFAADLKVSNAGAATGLASGPSYVPPLVNGHFAPLWGVVTLALGLNLEEAGYLFLLNHAKAVISAAVRASVMGPYMAQTVLAGENLQRLIRSSLERVWSIQPEDAGQVVPVMDLWIGRHEKLYSRIFNS